MTDKQKPQKKVQDNNEVKKAATQQAESETEQSDSVAFLDKVSGVAQKGVEAIKTGVEKAGQAAEDTAKLARLKLEMHKLSNEQNDLYVKAGTRIWTLKKANKADDLAKQLSGEIKQSHELQKQIAEMEKENKQ